MEKCVYLLDEILSLNGSDVKAIMDSGLNAQELIFSDGDYLQECLKLDKSLVSRLSSLKHLIAEISLQELRNKVVIKGTKDVVKYLEVTLRTLSVEHFVVLFLNKGNAVIDYVDVGGAYDNVQVDYRLIIKRALVSEAANIICAHNHPSGNVPPSIQDKAFTTSLKKILGYLNIRLLDHIIITADSYYSFVSRKRAKYHSLTDEVSGSDDAIKSK
ncbi:MAG: JAB domain-containing protein [Alphaproteobacteria bacterium]|nr:JAB domain-containing protein [Alphaproteobacteria bacterium]